LAPRDDAAELLVAFSGLHEHGQVQGFGAPAGRFAISGIGSDRQFGADDGFYSGGLRGAIELRRAVQPSRSSKATAG
jgi:hypothetical protein